MTGMRRMTISLPDEIDRRIFEAEKAFAQKPA